MRAVKITEPCLVFGEMCRDPIDNHADLALMKAIHQIHKVRGRAEAAGWRIVADDFIAPGAIERIFHDWEEFDVGITSVMNIFGDPDRSSALAMPSTRYRPM